LPLFAVNQTRSSSAQLESKYNVNADLRTTTAR